MVGYICILIGDLWICMFILPPHVMRSHVYYFVLLLDALMAPVYTRAAGLARAPAEQPNTWWYGSMLPQ